MILLVLQTMTQLSAYLANQIHFLYAFTVVPNDPLCRNKILCHIALPHSTKYNTTCIKHSFIDTKFHHCGGTHCSCQNELNEYVQALSHSDWPSTGHSYLSIDKQPQSQRSLLHTVNQSPLGSALIISTHQAVYS